MIRRCWTWVGQSLRRWMALLSAAVLLPLGVGLMGTADDMDFPPLSMIAWLFLMCTPTLIATHVIDYLRQQLAESAHALGPQASRADLMRRPQLGVLTRSDGEQVPIMFAETDDPGRFRPVHLDGRPVDVLTEDVETIQADRLYPGQTIVLFHKVIGDDQ